MLFEQIDQGWLKKISTEIKVDLKLASLTLRGADDPGPTRMAKLRIVESFIQAHHQVGTAQNPGHDYFRGQMAMQWGRLDDAVWFQGSAVDYSNIHYVGLGGSCRHLTGTFDYHDEKDASSTDILGGTNRTIQNVGRGQAVVTKILQEVTKVDNLDEPLTLTGPRFKDNWPLDIIETFDPLFPEDIVPVQQLTYLAVPLVEAHVRIKDRHPVHGVIGTPLYVALAGPSQPLSGHP
jgi:hypothetical protein